MRGRIALPLLIVAAALLPACSKTVDEYVADLESVAPDNGDLVKFDESGVIFDSGQLAHEAFAGLAEAEQMQLWQVMRALYHACMFIGEARNQPLLQSDAAQVIAHIVTNLPVPPIEVELERFTDINIPTANFSKLLTAREPILIERYIEALNAPDEVVVGERLAILREKTGQDFGRDVEAWRAWFANEKDARMARFVEESRAPLQEIGRYRYRNNSEARSPLRILSLWLRDYSYPGVDEYAIPATLCVARQAAIHALNEAMNRATDAGVRGDVAAAMATIRDPAFHEPMIRMLERERDSMAAARIIRALSSYPGRRTILAVIGAMQAEDPRVMIAAEDTLESITGMDLGREARPWQEWWKAEGEKSWP